MVAKPLLAETAARVEGPICPYPVVVGEPEQTMFNLHWYFCTALAVTGPKYPVIVGCVKSTVCVRKRWRLETREFSLPMVRVRELGLV